MDGSRKNYFGVLYVMKLTFILFSKLLICFLVSSTKESFV